jgi:hypothetical protein
VLRLIAHTIQAGTRAGLPVAVCGEMAGDPQLTRLLLGMGLRQFSMHPAQILKSSRVLRSNCDRPCCRAPVEYRRPAGYAPAGTSERDLTSRPAEVISFKRRFDRQLAGA